MKSPLETVVYETAEAQFASLKALLERLDRDAQVLHGHSIGFGPTEVAPKATCIFMAQPSVLFLSRTMLVPGRIGKHFSINSVSVGRQSHSISSNAIPAEAYSETSKTNDMLLDICPPGRVITLSVTNNSYKPRKFSCTLHGDMMTENYQAIFDELLQLHRWRVAPKLLGARAAKIKAKA